MKKLFLIFMVLFLAFSLARVASAIEPDEILSDPVLETRAREVSKQLRCVVCQNQSIDDSNAELARDMRLLVRDRILAGDSNQDVLDYMVDRYGDYVLLKPPFKTSTLVLWLGPAALVVLGIFALGFYYRKPGSGKSSTGPNQTPLSDDERAKLDRVLSDNKNTKEKT